MVVQKIPNNNLILARDDSGLERIVMGKGLRFFCQVGQELPAEHVQKVFILREEGAVRRYQQLLQVCPPKRRKPLKRPWNWPTSGFPAAQRPDLCHPFRSSDLCH